MRGGWPLKRPSRVLPAPSASGRNTLNFFAGSAAKKWPPWGSSLSRAAAKRIDHSSSPSTQPFPGRDGPRAVRVIRVPYSPGRNTAREMERRQDPISERTVQHSRLWPVRREGPPTDPIDFLTASPIQGCWISNKSGKGSDNEGLR